MKRLLALLAFAVCAAAAVPSTGKAADIRVASYEMNETGGIVMLESDAPIGEPWLRIDAAGIRIWFPEVTGVARFDHARDARDPIRSLQLRPGASDSAVLKLELGTGRRLNRDDIEVTRMGQTARVEVRFERPAKPAAATAPATTLAASAARAAPQPSAATPKPLQLNGAATATAAPTAQVAPKPPQAAASSPSPSPAGAPVHTLASVASTPQPGLGLATGGHANLGALLALSGLLCAVYLAIRAYGKKKRSWQSTEIQVLSAHRLGHRSELMVVRALGADHLLVSSAGRVERVASVPTPVEPLAPLAPPLAPPPAPEGAPAELSQANGLGIISKLSSSYRVKKLLDAVDRESADPAEAPAPAPARPSFGPELMSAINHHKLVNLSALPPLTAKQSDAVAGIARLRAGGRGAN